MKRPLYIFFFMLIANFATAQKMVVFEKFTNVRCGACPNAHLTVLDILADNSNAIWLNHHKPWDENPLTNPMSDALWNAMNVPGPPIGMVDRKILNGSILSYSSQWRNLIEAQASLPSPVDLVIKDVVFDASLHKLSFDVEATFNTIPGPGPHNLTAYIVEDSINSKQDSHYNDIPGHPLEGLGDPIWDYWHRNIVRTIMDGLWGSVGVIPDTPEINIPYSKSYSYQVPEGYVPSKMSIVATVSKYNEQDVTDRLIYNGTRYKLRSIISSNKNIDLGLSIALSPNPALEQFKLELNKVPEEMIIVDVTGRPVRNLTALSKSMLVNVNSLNPGLYYLIVKTKEGIANKPFTVIH